MASTVARNKQDVDKMERAQRLYDSLDYSYTKKGEKISQEYDKSRSAADRAALGRGMQRSTQNLQTLANIDKQKLDALDDNYNTMIADYENRLTDLEEQDWQRDLQERQFAETQRQYDTSMAFQQAEADRAQQNTVWNQNFQQAEADRAQANTAWQQAFNERQYGDTQAYNTWNMAFQEKQAQLAADQWEKEYASGQSSTDRQIALNNLYQIAAQGNDPTDALLQQAGLSRADFNAMKAQVAASGGAVSGGSYYPGSNNPDDTEISDSDTPTSAFSKFINALTGGSTPTPASTQNPVQGKDTNKKTSQPIDKPIDTIFFSNNSYKNNRNVKNTYIK